MSDDLMWAENLGKAAGGVNRLIKQRDAEITRLRQREAQLVEALQACLDDLADRNRSRGYRLATEALAIQSTSG